MSRVSIVKCADYGYDRVKAAVRESIDLIGGMAAFVNPGEKVLLKANLVTKRRPERATTTHPALVRAVAELVVEAGGKPIIGDTPGGYHFYDRPTLEEVYEITGMREAAEKCGAELNYGTEITDVPYPQGKVIKSISTMKSALDVDKIINMPKLKSHMMMAFSGAVKNMFGIIPGRSKVEYHLRFEDTGDFANLLIDVFTSIKPVLNVMDAVVGMEGYGPTNGFPKQVGLVIASADAFSLDAVAATVVGIEPAKIPSVRKSIERGFYSGDFGGIEIVGEDIRNVLVLDFDKPTVKIAFNIYSILIPKPILKKVNRFIKPTPDFNRAKCTGCRTCFLSCPPGAIKMKDGKPEINLDRCIRCFCCHELCNQDAVVIKKPRLHRFLFRRSRTRR